jgi:hypothetical protein
MQILALVLSLLLPISSLLGQANLPSLSSASKVQGSSVEADSALKVDAGLDIKENLKRQLYRIDKQIEMVIHLKDKTLLQREHFEQKANTFYHSGNMDQYKQYMMLALNAQERVIELQQRLQSLEIKRNNLLSRMLNEKQGKQKSQ